MLSTAWLLDTSLLVDIGLSFSIDEAGSLLRKVARIIYENVSDITTIPESMSLSEEGYHGCMGIRINGVSVFTAQENILDNLDTSWSVQVNEKLFQLLVLK